MYTEWTVEANKLNTHKITVSCCTHYIRFAAVVAVLKQNKCICRPDIKSKFTTLKISLNLSKHLTLSFRLIDDTEHICKISVLWNNLKYSYPWTTHSVSSTTQKKMLVGFWKDQQTKQPEQPAAAGIARKVNSAESNISILAQITPRHKQCTIEACCLLVIYVSHIFIRGFIIIGRNIECSKISHMGCYRISYIKCSSVWEPKLEKLEQTKHVSCAFFRSLSYVEIYQFE